LILRLSLTGLLASGALAYPANKTDKLATVPKPKATSDKFVQKAVYPVTAIASSQIESYQPYTHLAASAYCASNIISTWTCGAHCSALPGMIIYATGGDNEDTPDWYVGYLPSLASAVVVHQGTTPSSIESDYVDASFSMDTLTPAYFPGAPSSVEVHSGFLGAHDSTASAVLTAVKKIMSDHGVTKVTCVGHSLGGAIAILDAISLQLTLPSTTSFKVITYGQPRVGNQAFADYVDQYFTDNTRITIWFQRFLACSWDSLTHLEKNILIPLSIGGLALAKITPPTLNAAQGKCLKSMMAVSLTMTAHTTMES